MKQHLETLLAECIDFLQRDGRLPPGSTVAVHVQRARDPQHGDFASNVAMVLAKLLGRPPRDVAQEIISHLAPSPQVDSVSVAGPGFINFRLAPLAFHQVVQEILASGEAFGRCDMGRGQRVCLEFVSANPTGPLHVGHGRGAAYGAALAAVLEAGGYQVHREYYVNDAGRQMDILAVSVWLRYLELCGETLPFPANGYRGDYVYDIAADLHRSHGSAFHRAAGALLQDLPPDADVGGDKERYIDALIARAKGLLGPEDYRRVFDCGLNVILADIRDDLEEFGVRYDEWFSERNLLDSGAVERAIGRLREAGQLYERDAALWFHSSALGDEKDRVVVRDNGQLTYFATDIAYHLGKLARGFERLIDIWGADHHGYVARLKAALAALSEPPDALEVLLVQFAVLYRGGEKVQMSTRSGEFVTLRELRQEVGGDAARFFYVMRKSDQHLDFDLDLAKSRTADNPVYYIQYAHARIASVMRQLAERGLAWDEQQGGSHLVRLSEPHEEQLLRTLSRYPEVIETAVRYHEPHQVAHYLRELGNDFHTYYNAHTFLVNDPALRDARLCLINAAGQVIRNGLALLGVSAPVTM